MLGKTFLLALGLLLKLTPESQALLPELKTKIQWVDPTNSMTEVDWPRRARWIWVDKKASVEVSVELPPLFGLKLHQVDSEEVKVDGPSLTWVLRQPQATKKFRAPSSLPGSKEEAMAGLVLSLDVPKTAIILHENCAPFGLQVKSTKDDGHFFYLSIFCSALKNGRGQLHISSSDDAVIESKQGNRKEMDLTLNRMENFSQSLQVISSGKQSGFLIKTGSKKGS